MKKILYYTILIAIIASGCNKNDTGSTNKTALTIKLTDAPGAYDAIFLNVKEIQIISTGGNSTIDADGEIFNILDFKMGRDTVIASQDIPSGLLNEVRFVLFEEGNTIVVNGISYPLTTPSGQSSGVKIKVNEELIAGAGYTLLLDFDAAKSIVKTGNGKYILKPVIRAIPAAVSGVIKGKINPASSNPKIYAINGTDTLGTVTDSTGYFWFPGVKEGTYKVEIVPIAPYILKTIEGITVSKGSIKDLGTITLSQ